MTGAPAPAAADQDNPWTTLSVEVRYETPWLKVEHHEVIKPNGAPGTYGLARAKKLAVGVLPIDPEGAVRLVGQWRYALGAYSWEIPAGGCEPGESPTACAQREMAEEAGVAAAELIEALRLHTSNCLSDEAAICYIALGLSPASGQLDDTEIITRRTLPFTQALDMAASGALTDALTVATLLRAHHMAVTGQLPPALAAAMARVR